MQNVLGNTKGKWKT